MQIKIALETYLFLTTIEVEMFLFPWALLKIIVNVVNYIQLFNQLNLTDII